jgi:hypothetical protein
MVPVDEQKPPNDPTNAQVLQRTRIGRSLRRKYANWHAR